MVAVDFRDIVQGKSGGLLESGKVRILQQSFHLPLGVRICDTYSTGIHLALEYFLEFSAFVLDMLPVGQLLRFKTSGSLFLLFLFLILDFKSVAG